MRGGLLDVPQRHASVQGRCDERVPERMRADVLADPGAASDAADDPARAVPVQPLPVRREKDRPFASFANRQVDRSCGPGRQRDRDDFAALAGDHQRAMATLGAQRLDIRTGRFRDSQPVQREQRDQGVLGSRPEPGGYEQGAALVAVKPSGVRLAIDPGTANMSGRGMLQQLLVVISGSCRWIDVPCGMGALDWPCLRVALTNVRNG